jgi:hypothetical protein
MANLETGPASVVGEELNTVSFVMDYVEFGFNGPVLRALTSPIVDIGGERPRFPAPGSRDALCDLIGRTVRAVDEREEISLTLELTGGARLTIPLDYASRVGPEAMHFHCPGAPLMVW